MRVLRLLGRMGVGKDTAADRLVEAHGWVKLVLADPLKRICRDVFGFTDDQLWGPSWMRNMPVNGWERECPACKYVTPNHCATCNGSGKTLLTPREALQTLGTDWGRRCHPDVWVRHAMRTAKALLAGRAGGYDPQTGLHSGGILLPITSVVIPDVRFQNEAAAIRAAGGRVVRLVRRWGAPVEGFSSHVSEQGQDGVTEVDSILDVPEGVEAFHAAIDRELPALMRGAK